jgi:hypothetical protein
MPRLHTLNLLPSVTNLSSNPALVRLQVPELREASISGLDVALCGTNLRFLSLQCPPQSPARLLEMLSASSQLESVTVDFSVLPAQRWDIFARDAIHLPKLGKLSLTSNTWESDSAILAVLQQLCLPDDVCIELTINRNFAGLGDTVTTLMNALLPYLYFRKRDTVTICTGPLSSFSNRHSFTLHGSD